MMALSYAATDPTAAERSRPRKGFRDGMGHADRRRLAVRVCRRPSRVDTMRTESTIWNGTPILKSHQTLLECTSQPSTVAAIALVDVGTWFGLARGHRARQATVRSNEIPSAFPASLDWETALGTRARLRTSRLDFVGTSYPAKGW